MTRVIFFLLGFGLMVIGFTYIIIYMNLLSLMEKSYFFNVLHNCLQLIKKQKTPKSCRFSG